MLLEIARIQNRWPLSVEHDATQWNQAAMESKGDVSLTSLMPNALDDAMVGGGRRTRTFEVIRRLIYSQLPLPLGTLPLLNPIKAYPPRTAAT
jgi:hypothetical protein